MVLQLPGDTPQRMSTKALALTCLDYPLFFIYVEESDSLGGLAPMTRGFNGLQELLRRRDAGTVLLSMYRTHDLPEQDTNWTASERGNYLELILAQDSILDNLQTEQCRQVISIAHNRLVKRLQDRHHAVRGTSICAWLAARIMIREHFDEFMTAVASNSLLSQFLIYRGRLYWTELENISRLESDFLQGNR